MGRFINGLLIGAGVTLLIAPMKGEEMRRLVSERVSSIRTSLSKGGQGSQYLEQAVNTVSQTANVLKGNAQQAASQVKSAGSSLGDIAQQATTDVKQTSKNVAETTAQAAQSTKTNASQASTTI